MTNQRIAFPVFALIQVILVNHAMAFCDEKQNQFDPSAVGEKCVEGTTYDKTINCCTGCPVCQPGYRQLPGCIGGCAKCPLGHFSNNPDSLYCKKCTRCESHNRQVSVSCALVYDAQCGACLRGFEEIGNKCVRLQRGVFTAPDQPDPTVATPACTGMVCKENSEIDSIITPLVAVIGLLVGIFIGGIAVCLYYKCGRKGASRDLGTDEPDGNLVGIYIDGLQKEENHENDDNQAQEEASLLPKQPQDACDSPDSKNKELVALPPLAQEEKCDEPGASQCEIGSSQPSTGITIMHPVRSGLDDNSLCNDEDTDTLSMNLTASSAQEGSDRSLPFIPTSVASEEAEFHDIHSNEIENTVRNCVV